MSSQFKLSMSSWSYLPLISSGELTQKKWIELCQQLRLDGVELLDIHFPSLNKDYLDQLKNQLAQLGLEVACCSVSNDFGKAELKDRQESEKLVEKWIELARWFGTDTLRIFAGWPGEQNPEKYEQEKSRLWQEMIERIAHLSEKAEKSGVVLALENHNHLGFTKTVDDLLKILRQVNSPWLRVCLDTGDYLVDTSESNGFSALEQALEYAKIIHAKFYQVDEESGDLKQDWLKILSLLKSRGWAGYLSIEYEGAEPGDEVPKAVRFLQKHLTS